MGAKPRDYAITIVVPFASDPAKVLPRIEAIVFIRDHRQEMTTMGDLVDDLPGI